MEVKTKPNTTHNSSSSRNLPPGFRFHPTDEELIVHYLKNQAMSKPCPVSIIPEVDIYKFDPWQLPEKAEFGEKEWYFFTPRERKYPNGVRPNRAAVSGYWKATGTDKSIHSGSRFVGIKKALVFYMGRPPKGIKTDWIMHEYRLNQPSSSSSSRPHLHVSRPAGSMRLDDWVLCRIYRKKHGARRASNEDEEGSDTRPSMIMSSPTIKNEPSGSEGSEDHHHQMLQEQQQQQMSKFPRTFSLTHLLELDYLGPITHLLNDPDGSYIGNSYELANSGFDTNGSAQGLFGDFSRTPMNQIGAGFTQQWQSNSSFGYKLP